MPKLGFHMFDYDHEFTEEYIPKIPLKSNVSCGLIRTFRNLESRYFHEGRIVKTSFSCHDHILTMFKSIGFDCLLNINEQICPQFILEFYSQVKLAYNKDQTLSINFP